MLWVSYFFHWDGSLYGSGIAGFPEHASVPRGDRDRRSDAATVIDRDCRELFYWDIASRDRIDECVLRTRRISGDLAVVENAHFFSAWRAPIARIRRARLVMIGLIAWRCGRGAVRTPAPRKR